MDTCMKPENLGQFCSTTSTELGTTQFISFQANEVLFSGYLALHRFFFGVIKGLVSFKQICSDKRSIEQSSCDESDLSNGQVTCCFPLLGENPSLQEGRQQFGRGVVAAAEQPMKEQTDGNPSTWLHKCLHI